jgi:DNA-binding transcriptional MocR family regulator
VTTPAVQLEWGQPVRLHAAHHGEWRKAVVRDRALSPSARLVACVIVESINWGRSPKHQHLAGLSWLTQQQIAEEVGVSDRQVRRNIEDLETRGWIAVSQRSLGKASTTRLMWPKLPFDRTPVSGQRKVPTRTPRALTGHFTTARPDTRDRFDRTPVSGNHLEDLPENHLEARPRAMEGVSAETMAAYTAASADGSPEDRRQALKRVLAEQERWKAGMAR